MKECPMPDVTISSPVTADSVDRLALGASDARTTMVQPMSSWYNACMAED
jgi:hypothetical protein